MSKYFSKSISVNDTVSSRALVSHDISFTLLSGMDADFDELTTGTGVFEAITTGSFDAQSVVSDTGTFEKITTRSLDTSRAKCDEVTTNTLFSQNVSSANLVTGVGNLTQLTADNGYCKTLKTQSSKGVVVEYNKGVFLDSTVGNLNVSNNTFMNSVSMASASCGSLHVSRGILVNGQPIGKIAFEMSQGETRFLGDGVFYIWVLENNKKSLHEVSIASENFLHKDVFDSGFSFTYLGKGVVKPSGDCKLEIQRIF